MKKGLSLSKRLSAIYGFCVTAGEDAPYVLCDVGCDHAHVPIRLLKDNVIKKALCMDVIPGPLRKAEENLSLYGCGDKAELILSDGLRNYPGGADVLLISGMGGMMIAKILREEAEKAKSFRGMILQPQSEFTAARRAVYETGFVIRDECMIEEDGKFYPVLYATPSGTEEPRKNLLSDEELEYGPVLLRKKDAVLRKYLETGMQKVDRILAGFPEDGNVREKETLLGTREQMKKALALIS